MSKSRQSQAENWLNSLFGNDWKFSAKSCLIIVLLGYLVIPALFSHSLVLSAFIPPLQALSKYAAGLSGLIALFKLSVDWINAPLAEEINQDLNEKVKTFPHPKPRFKTVPNDFEYAQKDTRKAAGSAQTQWSVTFLQSLDWKVFETLCSEYFLAKQIPNTETNIGADGGIDLKLFTRDANQPFAIAQCKQWSTPVGVNALRELLGVMVHEKVEKGVFITSNRYHPAATAFAKQHQIKLITGFDLVKGLNALDPATQQRIYLKITKGDFTTPTCVKCGSKMIKRKGKDKRFWGCQNYPRCKHTLKAKKSIR